MKKHITVKNSRKEEYDMPQQLDLLNKWTIPKNLNQGYRPNGLFRENDI